MTKQVKEFLLDQATGEVNVEYDDDSTIKYNLSNAVTATQSAQVNASGTRGVEKTTGPVPVLLASCAIGATISASGTGTLIPAVRIPIFAGDIFGGETLRFAAQLSYTGVAAGRGWALSVVAPGASSGVVVAQQFPTTTVLYTDIDVSLHIDPARKAVRIPVVTVPATGLSAGQSTTAAASATVDFTTDRELLLTIMPQSGDRATLRGFSLTMNKIHRPEALRALICYGDSLTFGVGATAGNDYPTALSRASALMVRNEGVAGETAQQITSRVVANAASLGTFPTIFQMGRNNVGQASMQSDVLASLAASIAALGHGKFLVGSVTPMSTETLGTSNRTAIIACNAAIAAAYPDNYVDTLTALATNAGEIPGASYSDTTHFTDAGYLILAQTYATAVAAKGW